jgi:uncharacterized protein YgiB involved in biofilm formation
MKERLKKRSSLSITLAFIGTVAISCGQSGYRQQYKSKEDCLADWNTPDKCEQAPYGSSSHYYPGYYYGPFVSGRSMSSTQTASRAVGTTSVTRGGFGSSALFHSGGS